MRPTRGASWCLLLSLLGIGLCGHLIFTHLGLLRGELVGGPACGGSGAFNCHVVTASSWGSVLGMPLPIWGLLGYIAAFALSLLARQSADWAAQALTVIFLLAVLFVGIDLILFALMVFVIRFFCLFCLLTYAVNLFLLFISARSLGRPWRQTMRQAPAALGALLPSGRRPAAWLFWGVMVVGVSGSVGLHAATTFVSRGHLGSLRKQLREFIAKQPRVSPEVAGDPMIGQPNAPLRIVEFSDFLCPVCQRASKLNTIILTNHRRDAVFIFKHFPLDMSCNNRISRMAHPGACQIAAASECAHLQGKFWPFHDRIFEEGHEYKMANLEGDAERVGLDLPRFKACLASGQGLEAVKRDIAEGGRIGVTSTPTYVINGVPVTGGVNPSMFEDFVAVLQEVAR